MYRDLEEKVVMVYLDGIFIYGDTCENHKRHVKLVLDRLCEHKLYAKLSECKFGMQEVEYLGFILKAGKLAMNLNKTKAMEVCERPTTKKELQSFLGLVNY